MFRAAVLSVGVFGLCLPVAWAAGRFVEDVQVSRSGEEAAVTIVLACRMRFQSDVANPAGMLVEIRVAPLDDCQALSDSIASELYRPVGGRLANLVEIEYESLGLGDNLLLLKFDRPVAYRVAQRGNLRTLELRVRTTGEPQDAPMVTPGVSSGPVAVEAATVPEDRAERAPLASRVRAPLTVADYVLNLQSTRDPVDPGAIADVPVAADRRLYVSTTEVGGVVWYRLRLGFFGSEAEARVALEALAGGFPRAWIGRAEATEVQRAADLALERGGVVTERDSEPVESELENRVVGALAPDRLAELLAEARAAIVAGDFATAIRNYTRVLEEPGEHAAEARENLGVAREKNGQAAHAVAEYRRFLADYPQHEAVARVRQRLNGLMTASAPRERLRATEAETARWDLSSGIAQYYRRDVDRFDQDQPEITTLSAIFTDVDLSVGRSGTAIDWRGRIALNHLHDLIGEAEGGPGDRKRIAYAYVDVAGVQDDWSLRAGRQTLHNWGVLGRFDGVHGTYDWAPDRRLHLVTGFPVESTRHSVETDRQFVGAAVDFEKLIGAWTVSPFVMRQTIDGIPDRQAVGVDVRYFDDRRSFTSMLDYDVEYGEMNIALLFGTWRVGRVTLTGLFDQRLSPVLTTRNALIGQPVGTIDELLLVWTEDEIRQIARERTADGRTVTLGVAAPIAERWQVNADVTVTEIGDSAASAGVVAVPGTGAQTYYSASFVGSSLFATSDTSIFNVRVGTSDEFTASQLTWDLRLPVGRKLRINPRLRLGIWDSPSTGRRRETLTPSLRLLLNTSRHYRLELEAGTETLNRTDSGGEQEATGQFFNLGYRADF